MFTSWKEEIERRGQTNTYIVLLISTRRSIVTSELIEGRQTRAPEINKALIDARARTRDTHAEGLCVMMMLLRQAEKRNHNSVENVIKSSGVNTV